MVTVTRVETTNDLSFCKLYLSIFSSSQEDTDETLSGIKSSLSYIRKLLASRVNLRKTPSLSFVLDDSIEYGAKISKLLHESNKEENSIEEIE